MLWEYKKGDCVLLEKMKTLELNGEKGRVVADVTVDWDEDAGVDERVGVCTESGRKLAVKVSNLKMLCPACFNTAGNCIPVFAENVLPKISSSQRHLDKEAYIAALTEICKGHLEMLRVKRPQKPNGDEFPGWAIMNPIVIYVLQKHKLIKMEDPHSLSSNTLLDSHKFCTIRHVLDAYDLWACTHCETFVDGSIWDAVAEIQPGFKFMKDVALTCNCAVLNV